jgi:hypothetical protein
MGDSPRKTAAIRQLLDEADRPSAPCSSFQVVRRNPGHWDIYSRDSRHFCIRGEADRFTVWNERDPRDLPSVFRTVDACMSYVCAELMTETNDKNQPPPPMA